MMDEMFLSREIVKKNGERIPIRELKPEEQLKYEIADELGLFERIVEKGWGTLTASESGRIGGLIKKRHLQQKVKKEEHK